jgi:hypothetical protein
MGNKDNLSGVWRLASGVWRLASGVWRLASDLASDLASADIHRFSAGLTTANRTWPGTSATGWSHCWMTFAGG